MFKTQGERRDELPSHPPHVNSTATPQGRQVVKRRNKSGQRPTSHKTRGPGAGPTNPSRGVLPDADRVRALLVKPGNSIDESLDGRAGNRHRTGREMVSEEIEPLFRPADKRFIGVQFNIKLFENPADRPDRAPELPAGRGHDDPVVHEPGVKQVSGS